MEKRKFRSVTLVADIVILTISFLVMVWTKPASLRSYLPTHTPFFIGLAVMWIIVSLLNGKMNRGKIINFTQLYSRVLTSNIIATSITHLAMYIIQRLQLFKDNCTGNCPACNIWGTDYRISVYSL